MALTKFLDLPQIATIKTPQSLIHIKHKISILQYKYWILLLQELRLQLDNKVGPDESGFRHIPLQKISDALGYLPNKAELFKDLLALKNETIAFNVLGKDGKDEQYGAGFISEWKVTSNKVSFIFPTFLESVVKGLEESSAIFQLLNWQVFNHFSGKYEAVIYKLCKDYVGVGQTPYMTLDEFREYMGLRKTEYTAFKDLNRNVIVNPCKKINENDISDIEVEVELEKVKRVVIGLRFKTRKKHQTSLPFAEFEPNPAFRFAKVFIEPKMQKSYLSLRSPEEVEQCIERANLYAQTQEEAGKEINYGGLYRKSIEGGWHIQHLEQKKRQSVKKEKKLKEHQIQTEKRAEISDSKGLNRKEIDLFVEEFRALPIERQNELRAGYANTLSPGILKAKFERDLEASPFHYQPFKRYVNENSNS